MPAELRRGNGRPTPVCAIAGRKWVIIANSLLMAGNSVSKVYSSSLSCYSLKQHTAETVQHKRKRETHKMEQQNKIASPHGHHAGDVRERD